MGLDFINNQVDIGVRVEVPAEVFKHITDEVYEAKILYRTSLYNDVVRTFCMNPYGYVVAENTDGIITVNGHSYRDPKMHSKNTNFALLVSSKFTEPFHEPLQYGKRIASFSNMLGGDVYKRQELQIVARVNDQETIKNLVAGGMGISIISEKAAHNFLQEKRLLAFELDVYKRQLRYRHCPSPRICSPWCLQELHQRLLRTAERYWLHHQ